MQEAKQEEETSLDTANEHTGEGSTGKAKPDKPSTGGKSSPTEKKHTGEETHRDSQTLKMAANSLANLRACVNEFDTEESCDVQNLARKFQCWLDNFEACADFEELSDNR